MPPKPTADDLRALLRAAMRKGVPRADAEDLVVDAYEKARRAHDPSRGAFSALMQRIVTNEAVSWWRVAARRRPLPDSLVAPRPTAAHKHRAETNQRRLLEALDAQERAVFAAWALQRHLPRGAFDASTAADAAGLDPAAYENAKRRLKTKVHTLSQQWGLEPRDFFSVDDHEGPRKRR